MGGAVRAAGVAACLLVAGLAVTPAPPAGATTTSRPTAVAVASDGTSYVGFASGGWLARRDVDGTPLDQLALPHEGPVTALTTDPGDRVWVDQAGTVTGLTADGAEVTTFAVDSDTCPVDNAHDPRSSGGIAASPDALYVAGRCTGVVEVHAPGGGLRATVDLPGSAAPRGVAWQPAQAGQPARLFVAVPATSRVYVYVADTLTSASTPLRTLTVAQQPGFRAPVPTGVAADAYGQLVVADAANNALYFYDADNDFTLYRTLGHPPDPSAGLGYLSGPAAVAQHAQDDSDLAGNLWVADTGNGRLQRWTTEGATLWMSDVPAPGPVGAPVNTVPPEVTGPPFAGSSLACSTGAWDGAPTSYSRQWLRDGAVIADATSATYAVVASDAYHSLSCAVRATSAAGTSAPSVSEPVLVPGPDSPPVNLTRPVVTGTPTVGQLLTCGVGGWTGSPTAYRFGWRRDAELRAGTNSRTYLVTADDVAHDVSCRVTAGNAHGFGGAATSAGRTVLSGGAIPIQPPQNTTPPSVVGVPETGQELYCDPGVWTNGPTFTYVWKVDDGPVGGATSDTYTLQPADAGRRLRCVVTGTNPRGLASVTSATVYPVLSPTDACPGGPSVAVGGGTWVRSRRVTLRILLPEGATAVQISNSSSFADAVRRRLDASCGYPWRLPRGGSEATVRVRFPGAADPTAVVKDTVRVDTWVPKVTRADAAWDNGAHAWRLHVRGTDRGSGLKTLLYAKGKGSGVLRTRYGTSVRTPDRTQIQWVRLRDRAGNASAWVQVQIAG